MDAQALVVSISKLMNMNFGIYESNLEEVRKIDVHSSAKAEAL